MPIKFQIFTSPPKIRFKRYSWPINLVSLYVCMYNGRKVLVLCVERTGYTSMKRSSYELMKCGLLARRTIFQATYFRSARWRSFYGRVVVVKKKSERIFYIHHGIIQAEKSGGYISVTEYC